MASKSSSTGPSTMGSGSTIMFWSKSVGSVGWGSSGVINGCRLSYVSLSLNVTAFPVSGSIALYLPDANCPSNWNFSG